MAALTMLANLPTRGNAFSKFTLNSAADDEDGSPPRKAAKFDLTSSPTKGKGRLDDDNVRRMRLNLRTSAVDLKTEVESRLPLLRRSIQSILSIDNSTIGLESYEYISLSCSILVSLADKGAEVQEALKLGMEKSAGAILRDLDNGFAGLKWLDRFVTRMEWLDRRMNLLRSILYSLDCNYKARNPDSLSVREICLDVIRVRIYDAPQIIIKIEGGIQEWAKKERSSDRSSDGDVVMESDENATDHALIARFISVLNTVGLFSTLFLTPYLHCTTEFYDAECEELSKELPAPNYFLHCEKRLSEEEERATSLLDENSRAAIIRTTEQAFLSGELLRNLVKDGVVSGMKNRDVAGLKRMYDLYGRMEAVSDLRAAFEAELQAKIKSIVTDSANDDKMISRLLEEKAFLDKLLVDAFHERPFTNNIHARPTGDEGDRLFGYAARDAFEKGFLSRKRKPAEMIAKHIDQAMRRGQREESEEAFWEELDSVLGLYRFTPDKDVFRTFYERALAKRLLLQKSASDALEERVINRLRDGYDPEFGKGNDMFKDIALSQDLLDEYRTKSSGNDEKMSAMVLKFSTWPFKKYEGTVNLPAEMSTALASFTEFYKQRHERHKLEWNYSLGTVTMSATFDNDEKELSVSLYQAVVLLLFQEENKLSFQDILQRSGLKSEDLIPTLQSLALGKVRVLVKRPTGKDINDTDEFIYNVKFTEKRRKLHIPSIQQQETVEETKQIEQAIDMDRQASIDAAIVRIMKGVKKLLDEELKIRTIEALRKHFIPSVPDIKKRIEHLLEREYIERDEKNNNMYLYVA